MKKLKISNEHLKELFEARLFELAAQELTPSSFTFSANPSIKTCETEKARITFHNEAMKKMLYLIQECDKEIGWHGVVKRTSNTEFEITDILVFPQVVSAATVTPDEKEYTNWIIKLAMEEEDALNNLRFHGHSHVNMGVTPSGTDITYQETVTHNIKDFYIFGIFNKKGASWFNIMDFKNNILYEKEDIIYEFYTLEEEEWAKEQIKKYVTIQKAVTSAIASNAKYGDYYGIYGYCGETNFQNGKENEDIMENRWKKDKKTNYQYGGRGFR